MTQNQEGKPNLAGRAGGPEPNGHVADAGDVGGGGSNLSEPEGARPDPPQPPPRDYGRGDENVRHTRPAGGPVATERGEADNGSGGDSWNRALGGNTNAGTLRLLAAVGLFVLMSASLFWLAAG